MIEKAGVANAPRNLDREIVLDSRISDRLVTIDPDRIEVASHGREVFGFAPLDTDVTRVIEDVPQAEDATGAAAASQVFQCSVQLATGATRNVVHYEDVRIE